MEDHLGFIHRIGSWDRWEFLIAFPGKFNSMRDRWVVQMAFPVFFNSYERTVPFMAFHAHFKSWDRMEFLMAFPGQFNGGLRRRWRDYLTLQTAWFASLDGLPLHTAWFAWLHNLTLSPLSTTGCRFPAMRLERPSASCSRHLWGRESDFDGKIRNCRTNFNKPL